jgi:hypothetical protein
LFLLRRRRVSRAAGISCFRSGWQIASAAVLSSVSRVASSATGTSICCDAAFLSLGWLLLPSEAELVSFQCERVGAFEATARRGPPLDLAIFHRLNLTNRQHSPPLHRRALISVKCFTRILAMLRNKVSALPLTAREASKLGSLTCLRLGAIQVIANSPAKLPSHEKLKVMSGTRSPRADTT